jgi:hypothetical protein
MTIRVVLAMAWSFLTGLAGGWLVLSPWALGQQAGSGSWTTVTNAQVRTGLGLLVLALIGLAVVVGEAVSALRGAGLLRRRATAPVESEAGPRDQRTVLFSEDLDRAMISLANALAADLSGDRRGDAAERPRTVDTPREGYQ